MLDPHASPSRHSQASLDPQRSAKDIAGDLGAVTGISRKDQQRVFPLQTCTDYLKGQVLLLLSGIKSAWVLAHAERKLRLFAVHVCAELYILTQIASVCSDDCNKMP